MTLYSERVQEVLEIFFQLLSIDSQYRYKGIPVKDILPFLKKDIFNLIEQKPLEAESLLDWFANSVFYMRGDTDEIPHVDIELRLK